jgi:hypothetical protein
MPSRAAARLRRLDDVVRGGTSQFVSQKPQPSIDNGAAYAKAGGRILFSHLQLYWLQRMTGFSATAM